MPRPLAGSRLALTLRRLRGRFGIAAPKVAIRTHVSWPLRVASVVGIVAVLAMLSGWAYDAGRRIAGFHQTESSQAVSELRQANAALEEELARLRSLLTTSESSLQIERASQKLLAEKHGQLALENARLKEDLAVFERLAQLEENNDAEINIDRFVVQPEGRPGHYRYAFLIALQGARRGKEAQFDMQLVIFPKGGDQGDKIVLPRTNEKEAGQYRIVLRNFRRIEGRFEIPGNHVPGGFELRIYEKGLLKARTSASP